MSILPLPLETPQGGAPEGVERRFAGVGRLYGEDVYLAFCSARVAVVGLGGVGSWAAEALARSGVGEIILIDLDHVAESNTNRQIHALGEEFGKAKATAMAERVLAINPRAIARPVEEFLTAGNCAGLLESADHVVDCIDDVRAKAALIAHASRAGLGLVTCGAAGGRSDPQRIRCADLAEVTGDPLLAKVRYRLRREHGFARPREGERATRMRIESVFSDEPIARIPECDTDEATIGAPLSCAGYGSCVTVTAAMGLNAAARILRRIKLTVDRSQPGGGSAA